MAGHVDILDERDSLRKPFFGSIALHGLVFASIVFYAWQKGAAGERFGDPNSLGGGTVGITSVSRIPLPQQGGITNPVANDTESRVPAPPPKPKEAVKAPEEDPAAVSLKTRRQKKRASDIAASRQKYRNPTADRPHQLHSSTGQATASPMFGTTTGSGGVGIGTGSPFGTRFGWYERLLRERVARAWKTGDVDARLQTAPPVIVNFEILRDGSIRNLRVMQRSGNLALDNSAQRAVLDASPLPPLPSGYERDVATVEFHFRLMR